MPDFTAENFSLAMRIGDFSMFIKETKLDCPDDRKAKRLSRRSFPLRQMRGYG